MVPWFNLKRKSLHLKKIYNACFLVKTFARQMRKARKVCRQSLRVRAQVLVGSLNFELISTPKKIRVVPIRAMGVSGSFKSMLDSMRVKKANRKKRYEGVKENLSGDIQWMQVCVHFTDNNCVYRPTHRSQESKDVAKWV